MFLCNIFFITTMLLYFEVVFISMVREQLRYYVSNLEEGINEFFWNFLIINKEREQKQISDKIRFQLAPVIEENEIDEGLIRGSGGLHYCIRSMVSPKYEIDFSSVYKGKIENDRRLQPKKQSNYEKLIDLVSSGKI